jgi:hypothetical protein
MAGHDEQRVRTMAGWVGVEISRSRVRTPGKAGYGLYRVRTAAERHWHVGEPPVTPAGEWTAYAFTLEQIARAVNESIQMGMPDAPMPLHLNDGTNAWPAVTHRVPTRWTSRYQGRRDLGVRTAEVVAEREDERCSDSIPVRVRPEVGQLLSALVTLVDEGLVVMRHDREMCSCRGTASLTMACVRLTTEDETVGTQVAVRRSGLAGGARGAKTARQRQRVANAKFQREHEQRRKHGKAAYHARKLSRGERSENG